MVGASRDPDLALLLTRAATRDREAFATLYKRTRSKLYGVIARILPRSELAAEVLQEAYVRIWEKVGDFPTKGSAIAWMATIARNRALDEVAYSPKSISLVDFSESFEPMAEYVDSAGSGCLNSFPRMISGAPPGFVRSMAPGVGCDAGRAIARP